MRIDNMDSQEDELEIGRLKAAIVQEKQMTEMLLQSEDELKKTVEELEKRWDSLDQENNEWKTRYETQVEINEQLTKQSHLYHDKIDDARMTFKESKMPKSSRVNVKDTEISQHQVSQMERTKQTLEKQLRDTEWRLDQESKAYHKANEERKQHVMEINAHKDHINRMKNKQKLDVQSQSESLGNTPRGTNIPADQRILDPKRGPIRKTAAVKSLPRLEQ